MGDKTLPLGYHRLTHEKEVAASYRPFTGEVGQESGGRVSVCGVERCPDLVCEVEAGKGPGEEEGAGLSSEIGRGKGGWGMVMAR